MINLICLNTRKGDAGELFLDGSGKLGMFISSVQKEFVEGASKDRR